MDWNEVICTNCGLINDYYVRFKKGQLVCRCNGCDKFLGCKPKDPNYKKKEVDLSTIVMPFGKYIGMMVTEVDDKYLWWLYENIPLKGFLKLAIHKRLNITGE